MSKNGETASLVSRNINKFRVEFREKFQTLYHVENPIFSRSREQTMCCKENIDFVASLVQDLSSGFKIPIIELTTFTCAKKFTIFHQSCVMFFSYLLLSSVPSAFPFLPFPMPDSPAIFIFFFLTFHPPLSFLFPPCFFSSSLFHSFLSTSSIIINPYTASIRSSL